MTKFCAASFVLLFAFLHSGSAALRCYESTCLDDPVNINSCVNNNRTVLKECNSIILQKNLQKLQQAGGTVPTPPPNPTWSCIKHEITGVQSGQTRTAVLRMCFPKGPSECEQVTAAAKGLDYQVATTVVRDCHTCDSDSCNPAGRATASSLVAIFASAAAAILLLRH